MYMMLVLVMKDGRRQLRKGDRLEAPAAFAMWTVVKTVVKKQEER